MISLYLYELHKNMLVWLIDNICVLVISYLIHVLILFVVSKFCHEKRMITSNTNTQQFNPLSEKEARL